MTKLVTIAVRNLARYTRRTLLTAALIAVGVIGVVVFSAASQSFKGMMIGQMTDSMLGHLQIHRAGYVASIDNLPLTLNLSATQLARVDEVLRAQPEVEAWSPRLKFGALVSNYAETTSIRLNAVYPDREFATVPLLPARIKKGAQTVLRGQILIPDLLASGLGLGPGDTVVIIATNRDGSVNAAQLTVGGIIDGISGPGGRDGYLHIDDAAGLLRLEAIEISEVAVRLRDFGALDAVTQRVSAALGGGGGAGRKDGTAKKGWEVHSWESLSPFASIASMIDVLTLAVRLALVAIVLISVMNVMLMSVYERVREIGTMAAMGTLPGRILALFVIEGFAMGAFGAAIGGAISIAAIVALRAVRLTFDFGRQSGLVLSPSIDVADLLLVSALVVLVAIAGSLQPAFKASRMEPVEALRHA